MTVNPLTASRTARAIRQSPQWVKVLYLALVIAQVLATITAICMLFVS